VAEADPQKQDEEEEGLDEEAQALKDETLAVAAGKEKYPDESPAPFQPAPRGEDDPEHDE
jgi:hypothetical protein